MHKLRCYTVCYKRSLLRSFANIKELFLLAYYNAHRIFWKSSTEVFQMFLSLASISWAILLFWPGDTLNRPVYHLMSSFASETTWATLFLIQGLAGICVLLFECRKTTVIVLDSILGCVLWTGSASSMFLSSVPPPAAISAEIIAAWFSWWLLIRLPIKQDD